MTAEITTLHQKAQVQVGNQVRTQYNYKKILLDVDAPAGIFAVKEWERLGIKPSDYVTLVILERMKQLSIAAK